MSAEISNLANLMDAKKDKGQKFVLMLGAGASISSGVKPTTTIMEELLQKFGQGIEGASVQQRFDRLWERNSDDTRQIFLDSQLNHAPSPGYAKLARLVAAGYFDLALTLNFDDLLERALQEIEFTDVEVLVRGDVDEKALQNMIDRKEPRFKLAKLHGSLKANRLLFTAEEMFQYPEPIEACVKRVTANDIIVCGYGFDDTCMLRAFAEQGGSIYDVDPGGPPRKLNVFLKNRRSEDLALTLGFDAFFTELHSRLLEARPQEPKPKFNPFKFLQSYEKADAESFTGRAEDTDSFFAGLQENQQVIVIAGPGKAGKTSLVKAALQPKLDDKKYQTIYLRCQPDIERSIPEGLKELDNTAEYLDLDLASSLKLLGKRAGPRRAVLFLDQFERVTKNYDLTTNVGRKQLTEFLRERVFKGCNENLTLVLVVQDEGGFLAVDLQQACQTEKIPVRLVACRPFDREAVKDIIKTLAQKACIEFDDSVVEDISKKFADAVTQSADRRFTLAHVQAVCHILAGTCRVQLGSYEQAFKNNLGALDQAINVCDFISFVEDFSETDAVWLRNIVKVPLQNTKDQIAAFIKLHYEELLPPGSPPPRHRPSRPAGFGAPA